MGTIQNCAKGDAIQFMVSTNGKTICGKNEGLGWRTRQVGGYISDDSLQQLSRDILNISLQNSENNGLRGNKAFNTGNADTDGHAVGCTEPHPVPTFTPLSTPERT